MKPERNPPLGELSLTRLLAMLFSPLAMRHMLEEVPDTPDRVEVAKVRYRNSLLLFEHIDRHITRSAIVIAACFFLQGLLSLVAQNQMLFVIVSELILAATVHAACLGIYRQVLHERVVKYAGIAGLARPAGRDPVEEFPRPDSEESNTQGLVDGRRPSKPRCDHRTTR
jgi:hypothetical protein